MDTLKLSDVLSPRPVADFVENVFGRTHLRVSTGQVPAECALESFERLIWAHEDKISTHLVAHRPHGEVTPPRRRQHKDLFRWAVDQFHLGHALRLEEADTIDSSLAMLAGDITRRLFSIVSTDLVVVPASASATAFPVCYDEDLLILQTAGECRWHTSTDALAPDGAHCLRAGDGLYVPSGNLQAFCGGSDHATAAIWRIRPLTCTDWWAALVEVLAEQDPDLRTSVPDAGGHAQSASYHDALERLSQAGHCPDLEEAVWQRVRLRLADSNRPTPGGHLRSPDYAATIDEHTLLQRRPGASLVLFKRAADVFVYVPGLGGVEVDESQPSGLTFPLEAERLLHAIIDQPDAVCAAQLPKEYTLACRLSTLRQLCREGGLQIATTEVNR